MNKKGLLLKPTVFSAAILFLAYGAALISLGASAESGSSTAYNINLTLVYGVVALLSYLLAFGYRYIAKNRERWLMLLFVAVWIVNTGYYMLSGAQTLDGALWANRVSYLGSVFLPLCMLMSIAGVCRIKLSKAGVTAAVVIGCLVFLLAASGGWLDIYYKEVSLVIENGTSRLEKVYGELHILFLVYLVVYFALMAGFVVYAVMRKKLGSYKYAAMLALVVLLNMLIWFLEQLVDTDFEFLSVSYIVSELLLLFIYGMLNDQNELHRNLERITAQADKKQERVIDKKPAFTAQQLERAAEIISRNEKLTSREEEVLKLTLMGQKRKAVADELCVSENTVKTHLSHIFAKAGVSSKKELLEKISSEME
ncbi:MAG: hypothetical protein IKJ27_09610 [Clostridia bacterium]|nr:hypothetical protein [Clostridia bacterium]